ncbi:MAG: UxaA family hydrolase [Succinivibrio sp.]|nr:UxaA family hydrolase [Succinivibrio sp.]
MSVKALVLAARDNVATLTAPAAAGDKVTCLGERQLEVTCLQDIRIWHKVALEDLSEGALVYKYGEVIGKTKTGIAAGGVVDHENIYSIPRDYASELTGGAA